MPFIDSLDIANRACTILGSSPITSTSEDSVKNTEMTNAYDKLRQVELRRNSWVFATRKCVLRPVNGFQPAAGASAAINPTMLLVPPLYSSSETYTPGAIVVDVNGFVWLSMAEQNTGNAPGGNNEIWEAYFGQMTVQPWTSGISYYSGELVYVPSPISTTAPPLYQIYMSLTNGNTDTPSTATLWSATTTYYGDQIVVDGSGNYWASLIELNLNNTPSQAPTAWSVTTAYVNGNQVTASDNFVYTASQNTTGNNPANGLSPTYWTNTGTLGAWIASPNLYPADIAWAPIIGCTMKNLQFSYPIGSGPAYDTQTRNAFRLPANFLRQANQSPKEGSMSNLGAPTGLMYYDWQLEGQYLTSRYGEPIIYRFIADIIKVRDMDAMFCEGLAARMAYETCERITQATDKQSTAMQNYSKAIGEARTINAIEVGAEEPPMDDYLSVRL